MVRQSFFTLEYIVTMTEQQFYFLFEALRFDNIDT